MNSGSHYRKVDFLFSIAYAAMNGFAPASSYAPTCRVPDDCVPIFGTDLDGSKPRL